MYNSSTYLSIFTSFHKYVCIAHAVCMLIQCFVYLDCIWTMGGGWTDLRPLSSPVPCQIYPLDASKVTEELPQVLLGGVLR